MNKILVTGGAGFIGSHVVDYLSKEYKNTEIIVLDKMTYAANIRNISGLKKNPNLSLIKGDVCDFDLCKKVCKKVDLLIHLAAESHVDLSFDNSLQFTLSNTLGTHTLMEASRLNNVSKIIHVSTDEVYGEISVGKFNEQAPFNPSNPYAASKAGAEVIVNSYYLSYNLPVCRIRANNIYGIRQFPEKIIPKFISCLIFNKKLPIHGSGYNIRTYLSIKDFISALSNIINKGNAGEVYNIGSTDEYSNLEIAKMICKQFNYDVNEWIEFCTDRPFNDSRYSISYEKISRFGWTPTRNLNLEIEDIVDWYKCESSRYSHLFKNCVEAL